jgi:hypothetical protein
MAEQTKPAHRKKGDKAYLEIEKLFMLSKPEKVKGKDGRIYEIFHRVGAAGGAFSKDELMSKLGFAAQLAEVERDANRRYRSISDVRSIVESRKSKLRSVLDSRVQRCKLAMSKAYSQEGTSNKLVPLMASVRIHSETEERKLFIQGFVNMDGEFVIGSRDDGALWAIEVMNGGRGIADRFKLAHAVGKDLLQKGISGPVKERLQLSLKP